MRPILHIHAGDRAAAVARASDLGGVVLAWYDSAAVGPCSRYRSHHLCMRTRYWDVDLAALPRPEQLTGDYERVLWFSPDPWEQLQLLELVACMPDGECSIVPLVRPVPELRTDQLAAAFAARRSAQSLRHLAAALWFDFCDGDLRGIERRLRHSSQAGHLPHLESVLRQVLYGREKPRAAAVA
jgi:hypothetical protein